MKESLRERKQQQGRLAKELLDTAVYQEHQKSVLERKERLLKEVLDSETIGEVRYKAGFIAGLDYLDSLLNQRVKQAVSLNKKN